MRDVVPTTKTPRETPAVFNTRFSRCQGLLYFIACRVLDGYEGAENAVQNCFRAASRNPPKFEHESAFRSWLLRVLIDKALVIRRQRSKALAVAEKPEQKTHDKQQMTFMSSSVL